MKRARKAIGLCQFADINSYTSRSSYTYSSMHVSAGKARLRVKLGTKPQPRPGLEPVKFAGVTVHVDPREYPLIDKDRSPFALVLSNPWPSRSLTPRPSLTMY